MNCIPFEKSRLWKRGIHCSLVHSMWRFAAELCKSCRIVVMRPLWGMTFYVEWFLDLRRVPPFWHSERKPVIKWVTAKSSRANSKLRTDVMTNTTARKRDGALNNGKVGLRYSGRCQTWLLRAPQWKRRPREERERREGKNASGRWMGYLRWKEEPVEQTRQNLTKFAYISSKYKWKTTTE